MALKLEKVQCSCSFTDLIHPLPCNGILEGSAAIGRVSAIDNFPTIRGITALAFQCKRVFQWKFSQSLDWWVSPAHRISRWWSFPFGVIWETLLMGYLPLTLTLWGARFKMQFQKLRERWRPILGEKLNIVWIFFEPSTAHMWKFINHIKLYLS